MELIPILSLVSRGLLIIILILLVILFVELIKIVKNFRRVSDRVEFLTDAKSWISVLKTFKKKK